jgi:GT2 family glycosyltransferase
MVETITQPEVWQPSTSVQTTEFERRPLLRDVSLVIPTLGRPILEQCLYWILVGSSWPGCLIIVEQGSNNDVAGWLDRVRELGIPVKHVISGQHGRSAGINRGLENADTRFVAITDDDCFVESNWLLNLADQLREHPQAVITGRVEAAGDSVVFVVTSPNPSTQNRPRLKFDLMSGGNMGTSLDTFGKVGLFDEDPVLATAEDVEWAYRALRRGIAIRYEPAVGLAHFGWRDTGKRADQYREYALSHGGFYGKYLRNGDWFLLARAAMHMGHALRKWVRGTIVRNPEVAMAQRAYLQYLLPGIRAGLRSSIRPGALDGGK